MLKIFSRSRLGVIPLGLALTSIGMVSCTRTSKQGREGTTPPSYSMSVLSQPFPLGEALSFQLDNDEFLLVVSDDVLPPEMKTEVAKWWKPERDGTNLFSSKRAHFPVGQGLVVNPKAQLNVMWCKKVEGNRTSWEACMSDTNGFIPKQNFFDNELNKLGLTLPSDLNSAEYANIREQRGQEVARAVGEALLILTHADDVATCYVEALRATEAFENQVPEPEAPQVANAFVGMRQRVGELTQGDDCSNRNYWPEKSECLWFEQRAGVLAHTLTNGVIEGQPASTTYSRREALARRLGKIESLGSQVEISPFAHPEKATQDEKNSAACSERADCFLTTSLAAVLKKYDRTGDNIVALGSEQTGSSVKPTKLNKDLADLLLDAAKLAKMTGLAPKNIKKILKLGDTRTPSCQDAAEYVVGNKSVWQELVPQTVSLEIPTAVTGVVRVEAKISTRVGDTAKSFDSGATVELGRDFGCLDESNGFCHLNLSLTPTQKQSLVKSYSRVRVSIQKPASPDMEIIADVSLSTLSASNYILLDDTKARALKERLVPSLRLAMYVEALPIASVANASKNDWQVVASGVLNLSNLDIAFVSIPQGVEKFDPPHSSFVTDLAFDGKKLVIGTLQGLNYPNESTGDQPPTVVHYQDSSASKGVIAFAHSDPAFFVISSRGLSLSIDGLSSFKMVPGTLPFEPEHVRSMATNGKVLALGTSEGLYLSRDQGKSFLFVDDAYPSLQGDIRAVTMLGNQLFLGTRDGLFVSQDEGRTFAKISLKPVLGTEAVTAIGGDGNLLVVGSSKGLAVSRDSGRAFFFRGRAQGLSGEIVSHIAVAGDVVAVAVEGLGAGRVSISKNSGENFHVNYTTTDRRLMLSVTSLEAYSSHGKAMIAIGTRGGGFFLTDDLGQTFKD